MSDFIRGFPFLKDIIFILLYHQTKIYLENERNYVLVYFTFKLENIKLNLNIYKRGLSDKSIHFTCLKF
jgi:hypothetical protein